MEKQWNNEIKSWTVLRNKADDLIKDTVEKNFPCPYGYPTAKTSPEFITFSEKKMGRALYAYVRSDLLIKTMELKRDQQKKKSQCFNKTQ